MTKPRRDYLTPEATQTLREMHPDPFVQAAIWRLYREAPGLLDAAPYVALARADGVTWDDLITNRTPYDRTHQED